MRNMLSCRFSMKTLFASVAAVAFLIYMGCEASGSGPTLLVLGYFAFWCGAFAISFYSPIICGLLIFVVAGMFASFDFLLDFPDFPPSIRDALRSAYQISEIPLVLIAEIDAESGTTLCFVGGLPKIRPFFVVLLWGGCFIVALAGLGCKMRTSFNLRRFWLSRKSSAAGCLRQKQL